MQSAQSKFQENKFGINFKQKAKKSKVFSYSRIRSLKAASWNHKRKKKRKRSTMHIYLKKISRHQFMSVLPIPGDIF